LATADAGNMVTVKSGAGGDTIFDTPREDFMDQDEYGHQSIHGLGGQDPGDGQCLPHTGGQTMTVRRAPMESVRTCPEVSGLREILSRTERIIEIYSLAGALTLAVSLNARARLI
jgi:hypothetical protein